MSVQTEIDRIITAVGAAYDAVEEKGGTLPASETVANLAEAINSIPKDTHQAVEQATPSLSLNAATGVVTAEATQAAGLVAAGTKKATMQLATQEAKAVTPSAAQQTAVASGKYTTGDVVVAAVPTETKSVDLAMPSGDQTVIPDAGKFLSAVTVKKPATMLPENIKKGVTIGGVVGTLESGGGGSTSETWVLNDELIETPTFIGAVKFTPSGTEFFGIYSSGGYITYWNDVNGEEMTPVTKEAATPEENAWLSPQYRKLVFNEAPTGELLQWLQFMGVKQPANLAVQPSKDVAITSNGTTEIAPDAPYDVMEKANVTVNVASGGGVGETTSLEVKTISSVEAVLFCLWQTSDGWMGTSNFDSWTNFTIPNVIVGGYVIFTRDPTKSWRFSSSATEGVEEIGVGAMDAEWDLPNAALVMKVTAPSPKFTFLLSS